MEVVSGLEALTPDHGRLFVVVGVFDGLHLGHLYLIRHLRREARRHAARPAVITFDAHPDEVLVGSAPPLLCDPDERLVRLEQAGVAVTIVWPFDTTVRMTPYDRWIDSIRERVELAGFLMTPDAAFGFERRGSPATVAAYGRQVEPPYDVVVVPPLELGGRPVRSAEIRSDVAAGDLRAARSLLGRSVSVAGDASLVGSDVRVSFPLPVALPPPGRYSAIVERAWTESAAGDAGAGKATARGTSGGEAHEIDPLPARHRTAAEVEPGGGLVLRGDGLVAVPRLRVTFVSPLR